MYLDLNGVNGAFLVKKAAVRFLPAKTVVHFVCATIYLLDTDARKPSVHDGAI